MNLADWVILIVVLVATVHAASEGFFHEAFGIAGLVVGYVLAAWQYWRVARTFAPYVNSPWLADIFGFLIIFFLVVIVAGIAGRIARWAMKEVGLSFFDRLLGAALGCLKGCLLVSIFLVGMTSFAPTSKWLVGSQLAPYFQVVGQAAIWVAPSELRARFYQGLDLLRRGR
ncbi:MAG TPA: CvpA family protein [Terriglobales bacterium]|nr:CvpA family protein [Terriglobales bacterium]